LNHLISCEGQFGMARILRAHYESPMSRRRRFGDKTGYEFGEFPQSRTHGRPLPGQRCGLRASRPSLDSPSRCHESITVCSVDHQPHPPVARTPG